MKSWDSLWINARIATCVPGELFIEHGAIAVKNEKIAWVGKMQDLTQRPEQLSFQVYDVDGRCITPGLIDCHTHLVYAGHRTNEFVMRLQGVSYAEILRQGGGIHSTVAATRAASEDELLQQSLKRARTLCANGVTTVEIKSGYGLNWHDELKMLRVARRIGEILPLNVCTTFLGAHAVPHEYKENPDKYVDFLCKEMIPEIAKTKLADAVDVFCERVAFNLEQTEKIFKTSKAHGLAVKCHAEQLSHFGAAQLAAKYYALSVDHLEFLTEEDIKKLSSTVAVLLPGAFYFLGETTYPPITLLQKYNIPIALASDCNPGSSPILSLLLILNMACVLFKMLPHQALQGVTFHAAQALDLSSIYGSLTAPKLADFAIWDVQDPVELVYYVGSNLLWSLIKRGNVVSS